MWSWVWQYDLFNCFSGLKALLSKDCSNNYFSVESITGDSPYSVTTVIEEVPMYLLVYDTLGYDTLENLLPMVYADTVRFQAFLFNKTI